METLLMGDSDYTKIPTEDNLRRGIDVNLNFGYSRTILLLQVSI